MNGHIQSKPQGIKVQHIPSLRISIKHRIHQQTIQKKVPSEFVDLRFGLHCAVAGPKRIAILRRFVRQKRVRGPARVTKRRSVRPADAP